MIQESKYISNDDYHSQHDYISSSGLKIIYDKSVFHYLNQEKSEPTNALVVGSATHTAILEPHNFDKEFLVIPKINKRTNAGKEEYQMCLQKAEKENKYLLEEKDFDLIENLKKGVFEDKDSKTLINYAKDKGLIEQSHFGQHEGVKMRIRPDIDIPEAEMLADLKTVDNNSRDAFRAKCNYYHWDLQAIMYCFVRNYTPYNFRWIVVEKKHPYSSQVYKMHPSTIDRGREKFFEAFEDYKKYMHTGLITKYRGKDENDDAIFI